MEAQVVPGGWEAVTMDFKLGLRTGQWAES